jgi:hypothetical protein
MRHRHRWIKQRRERTTGTSVAARAAGLSQGTAHITCTQQQRRYRQKLFPLAKDCPPPQRYTAPIPELTSSSSSSECGRMGWELPTAEQRMNSSAAATLATKMVLGGPDLLSGLGLRMPPALRVGGVLQP